MTTPLKMYNLNVNVATAVGGIFNLDGQCTTPRTPEILNALIAMTNPLDNLNKPSQENAIVQSEESCSNTGSPLGSPTNSPPSVQHTCSQLIKEGLKLTLQSKRKLSGSELKDELDEFPARKTKSEELTAEDEERRKRRRERNKIAATKCRLKKREKTANLVTEAELLETQNIDLKTQIQNLEEERRKLKHILDHHQPNCVRNVSTTTPTTQPVGYDTAAYSDAYIDALSDSSALHDFSKDPNLAKINECYFFDQTEKSRDKFENMLRGSFRCEDDSSILDVYRPNGSLEQGFFHPDSGFNSFNNTNTQLHNGCLA